MIAEALARTNDPAESHDAALSTAATVSRDRRTMLIAFDYADDATYREAAHRALVIEGGQGLTRLETFRKRGSDLKALGYITKIGRRNGQAVFALTAAGRAALAAS